MGSRKVSARGVDSAGGLEVPDPPRLFPLALPCSVSGARRAGLTITTSDDRRGIHAGETDPREKSGTRR